MKPAQTRIFEASHLDMQREECSQGITLNLHDGVGLKMYLKEALSS